jgi:hypothetical protein
VTIPLEVAARADGFAGRGWVAREVADWLGSGTERVLAITGEPGSGKTAIAAWLAGAGLAPDAATDAAALERVRGAWTATHFCIPGSEGTVDGAEFASSIAGQLAKGLGQTYMVAVVQSNNPQIYATASAQSVTGDAKVIGLNIVNLVIAAQSRADTAANISALWQGAVRKPLQELAATPPGPTALILVDALDEAARQPPPNIVTLVSGSNDFPPGIRFVVTASTDLDLRALFPGARVIDLSGAEAQARADDDVRAFLRAQLGPPKDAEDRLVAAASGNFLYVRLLVDEVKRGERSLDRLEGLPKGLYPLYQEYLDRVTGTAPGKKPGVRWGRELQPLLGCVSVATPSAPVAVLPGWLRKDAGKVSQLLDQARQVTEPDESEDGPGHRLYHRSMSDYFAAAQYPANGSRTDNRYHTPPGAQHARIAKHYLDNFRGRDWQQADSYGLRHLAGHLVATAAAETLPVKRRRLTADLYRTVLDKDFQTAQKATLGDLHSTLRDLRLGVDTALAGDESVPLLRCVAGYREVARSGAIAQGIFDAVDHGDFRAALRDAEHYGPPPRPRGRWARVLDAWIAWQAARAGRFGDAEDAAKGVVGQWLTLGEAEPLYWELCRALIVRAGRTIVAQGGDPDGLLRAFPEHRAEMTVAMSGPATPPLSPGDLAGLQAMLRHHLVDLDALLNEDPYEAVEIPFASAGRETHDPMSPRNVLIRLAATPEGQDGIDRTLRPTLTNPYARYRDIGLVAIGTAVVAVPDDDWADRRLRSILLAGLDAEGVTFTFELPSLLLGEAERRHLAAAKLGVYLARARDHVTEPDRWGTGIRALMAQASEQRAVGDADQALATLVDASTLQVGFAGYAAVTYLTLANRAIELGHMDAALEPSWGPGRNERLVDLAGQRAGHVLDYAFREERLALVEGYKGWLLNAPPDLNDVHAFVAVTPDPDARRIYKDFAAAHWTVADTSESREWLKSLVTMVLEDTTTLDAMLGRLVAGDLAELSDAEISDAVDIVATGLTAGRPWELGIEPS